MVEFGWNDVKETQKNEQGKGEDDFLETIQRGIETNIEEEKINSKKVIGTS